jgi:polyhydroxyalkanoate synthesis regulator phasin
VPAYRAGAERFETRDAAAAAAQKGNAPGARQARMLGAMEQTGDYAGAAQLRTAQVQATLAEQQLADRAMRDKLSSLRSPDELATMISETPADGMGGALKVRAVTSPDGKSFGFVQIGPDGTEKPVPGTFSNDEAGMEKARMLVAGYTTPEMRQQYFRWEQERAQRAAEFKETKAFQEKQLAEQSRSNQAREGIAGATLANSRKQLDLAEKTFKKQSLEGQVESIEKALGRTMAKDERENAVKKLAGIGTDEASIDKFASTLVQEAVKAGTMTAEDAPAARARIMAQIGAAKTQEKIRGGLARAKAEGKMPEAVKELRAKGLSDEQIVALGGDLSSFAPKTITGRAAAMAATRGITGSMTWDPVSKDFVSSEQLRAEEDTLTGPRTAAEMLNR